MAIGAEVAKANERLAASVLDFDARRRSFV